jgi:hypothetical protein
VKKGESTEGREERKNLNKGRKKECPSFFQIPYPLFPLTSVLSL